MTNRSGLRQSMGAEQADRLLMAIQTDDIIEALNIPLRARRGTFGLDYTGHTPKLYAVCVGCEPEHIASVDTRRRCAVWARPKQEPLALMVEDIRRRLAKLSAGLHLIVQRDAQQRRVAKLQVTSSDSRHIAIWLAHVPRHQRKGSIGPFTLNDETQP